MLCSMLMRHVHELTWDHGKKCDGTKRAFTKDEIDGAWAWAWEVVDDEEDDRELSGDYTDIEAKKPAAK